MKEHAKACCSSPASIGYWLLVSLVAWGALSLIGLFWNPLDARSAQTTLLAMSIGCFANWAKNRTLHCLLTGPLFLVFAILLLLADFGAFAMDAGFVWPIVAIGTGVAFSVEWRFCGIRRPKVASEDGKPREA